MKIFGVVVEILCRLKSMFHRSLDFFAYSLCSTLRFLRHAMRILMRLSEDDYNCQYRALCYLGKLFRLKMHLPDSYTDCAAGEHLMKYC